MQWYGRLALATLAASVAASAASASRFTIIANIPGGPQIGLYRGGVLYGTIPYAGNGVLFSLTKTGTGYKVLHAFDGTHDGAQPDAALVADGAGNIFGTAANGGTYGGGTLWRYSAAGVMSTPHAFGNGNDGSTPLQGPAWGRI